MLRTIDKLRQLRAVQAGENIHPMPTIFVQDEYVQAKDGSVVHLFNCIIPANLYPPILKREIAKYEEEIKNYKRGNNNRSVRRTNTGGH